jgi:hypothetical protein
MIYRSVLVLFTMFAGEFAAMVPKEGDLPGAEKASSCHAVCRGKCKMKGMLFDPEKFKVRKGSLPVLSAPNAETDGFKQSTTSSPVSLVALPQQEPIVSRMDNASILHTVSSDASKPMILTSIVDANAAKLDANAAKLDVPSAVVVSKDEVLPAETSAPVVESHRSDSAISGVSKVEKVKVKVKVKALQDPRIPSKTVSVGLDKVIKSKTKERYKNPEDGNTDNYETDAEEVDESDDEEENDENANENPQKLSFKAKINRGKKSDTSAGA